MFFPKGQTPITSPGYVYTGNSMTLTCGPPSVNVGDISGFVWTINGQKINNDGRDIITNTGNMSNLTINNVVIFDNGK